MHARHLRRERLEEPKGLVQVRVVTGHDERDELGGRHPARIGLVALPARGDRTLEVGADDSRSRPFSAHAAVRLRSPRQQKSRRWSARTFAHSECSSTIWAMLDCRWMDMAFCILFGGVVTRSEEQVPCQRQSAVICRAGADPLPLAAPVLFQIDTGCRSPSLRARRAAPRSADHAWTEALSGSMCSMLSGTSTPTARQGSSRCMRASALAASPSWRWCSFVEPRPMRRQAWRRGAREDSEGVLRRQRAHLRGSFVTTMLDALARRVASFVLLRRA